MIADESVNIQAGYAHKTIGFGDISVGIDVNGTPSFSASVATVVPYVARAATSNLEQAFDTKPLPYKEETVTLTHFDVAFENVDFSYNQQADVLHNVSFYAPEGTTTALIGPSGSGKSTVANLIARFWDVTKGCVRIGGQDIRELNPDGLLKYICSLAERLRLNSLWRLC